MNYHLMYLGAEAPVQQYACSFWVFKGGSHIYMSSHIYVSLGFHTRRNAYIYPMCILL